MNWYSVVGLVLDLVGVLLLGIDLIRLQRTVRNNATRVRVMFDEIESEYGGIESWAKEIEEQSAWIPEDSYSRHHSDEEVLFNARHTLDRLRDIASAVNGLAVHLAKITEILDEDATQNERISGSSLWISIVGVIFLISGFGLQLIGAWSSR